MADSASGPLSSQAYLEQLRQRRLQRTEPTPEPPVTTSLPEPPTNPQPYQPSPADEEMPSTEPQPTTQDYNNPNTAFRESETFPGQFTPVPEELIVEWDAPSRPFKKRDQQYYRTIIAIVVLISLILFFAGQFLPIAVVISIGFLSYVMNSIPPQEVHNKITTWGIHIDEQLYYWEEMGRFWFETKLDQRVMYIEIGRFPNRITLLLNGIEEEALTELLSEVLINQKPQPTYFDKAAEWLETHIPLEGK